MVRVWSVQNFVLLYRLVITPCPGVIYQLQLTKKQFSFIQYIYLIVLLLTFYSIDTHFDTSATGWLVVSGFNATLTAKVILLQSVTHMCFLAFSHQYLKQIFFPKPPTTFLTCFCRGEWRKYAGKESPLNQGSN